MNLEITFRKAIESDLTRIVELINSAYRGESSKFGWTTEADLLDGQRTDVSSLLEMISKDNTLLLVAEENSSRSIHGCVYLEKNGDKGYLGMLTVKPGLQGRGLGKMLLKESEQQLKEVGCRSIHMTVIASREELLNWYEKHGFIKTGETKPFPYDDERFGIPKVAGLYFEVLEKWI